MLSARTSDLFSRLPEAISEGYRDKPWPSLILVLIYELLQGKNSRWNPYLALLPTDDDFDTLMYWSEAELKELQASAIVDKIGKADAEEMFAQDVLPVIEHHPTIFYSMEKKMNKDQLMKFAHRAASIIMAYAFDLEDSEKEKLPDEDGYVTDEEDSVSPKFMVPMADMLNADADFNAHLFNDENGLTMRSTRHIKEGEEILNDYGPLPRAELLRRYGYITHKYTKYDVVEISLDLVVSTVKGVVELSQEDTEERLERLLEDDIAQEGFIIDRGGSQMMDKSPPASDGSCLSPANIPDELYATLQTMLANTAVWKKWRRALDAKQQEELYTTANRLLQDLLLSRLDQYTTNAHEDEELLRDESLSRRLRSAVEVRLGEKNLLVDARKEISLNSTENGHQLLPLETDEKRHTKRRKLG